MTLLKEPDSQRFVFDRADWHFYEEIHRRLDGRRVFVTYYKGKLEVVTTSFVHDRISFLLHTMVMVLAEETNTSVITSGRATLRAPDLEEGVEADVSFYIANVQRMRLKREIDLAVDPPPDLAVEVGVTRRLGERRLIYRDTGVPELWRYAAGELSILLKRGDDYQDVPRGEAFPQLSARELSDVLAAGLTSDETPWVKGFRQKVRAASGTP